MLDAASSRAPSPPPEDAPPKKKLKTPSLKRFLRGTRSKDENNAVSTGQEGLWWGRDVTDVRASSVAFHPGNAACGNGDSPCVRGMYRASVVFSFGIRTGQLASLNKST